MYLPSAFLLTGFVITAWRLGVRGRLAMALTVVMASVYAGLGQQRIGEYASGYGMWATVVERRPHGRAYLNLAVEADKLGRQPEVIPLLRRAVEDFPDAELPLGQRLYQARHYAEAITHLEVFLKLRPGHYRTEEARVLLIRCWTDLAIDRDRRGAVADAIDAFKRALAIDPTNPDLQRNLANAQANAR
jgi:tetratricopeptide (TPR) repeat protein